MGDGRRRRRFGGFDVIEYEGAVEGCADKLLGRLGTEGLEMGVRQTVVARVRVVLKIRRGSVDGRSMVGIIGVVGV